jgi:hypothetical protein
MKEKTCPYAKLINENYYCRSYIRKKDTGTYADYSKCDHDRRDYENCIWHIKFAWQDLPKAINQKLEDIFG